ncbi:OmpA family protein [Malonomonas rubra]|uniref:OmpA family protein n=1 Tax=Malonomonas rubra TaxID=57040 RepID=UPI0026EF0556|nr:OmpA family protein [Malonomonas rubra]
MMRVLSCIIKVTVLVCFIQLSACTSSQLKYEPLPVTANPIEETNKLETELMNARQEQVNILSPTWYKKSEGSLNQARQLISQKGDMGAIGDSISRGYAELKKAREMTKISRTVIADAIKGRELARVAGATALGDDYATIESQFFNLSRAIEENNLKYAQSQEKGVVDAYRSLEIRAIKENTLGEVRSLLAQADSAGADEYVPKQYARAKQVLQEADAFISENPYAKEEMHKKAETALFEAGRALQLTRQSKFFEKMEPAEVALWLDDTMKQSTDSLGAPDMRDQPLTIQVANVLGTANAIRSDREFLAERNSTQQAELQELRQQHFTEMSELQLKLQKEVGKNEQVEAEKLAEQERLAAERQTVENKLAEERRFNELYNQVQALFTNVEAECYKQGLQLVIRLRGMGFPVGQAIIMPENYSLLSKVQRAIRSFDRPQVMIEGHTDSTGSLDLNNHLSQMRAEAVREYLLANGVMKENNVVAVGFGPSRPLAPNNTSEGRAQNRRIDVVITPSGGQLSM